MPRPKRFRRILNIPKVTYFKPAGIPINRLEQIKLDFSELEAIRLKDHERLEQIECAKRMEISQSTFHRILLEARTKIADSLINGKAIKIEKEL
ncbi:MAG: DUF134 domain-containing protein [archaeon]|jgi:predicted DNA-binding protein (UPF0251 family)|nr:DUF134 domain-containing protein [archaeon]MDD2477442.1 DUF134 domain-containing protein [Candidatus ainarchaeum sp.]MDD3084700.1 DUF134 domain-containing protein [Candidatus ainarchaeum sp.]MDD4220973.1 DUF134 domain-containing protein [Candidatus ainarchaeum sp.]MDD4662456.1 DUF134 domain-containing protein [Candidatus ainarchaeum sp.]